MSDRFDPDAEARMAITDPFNADRLRHATERTTPASKGKYVLYWMQIYRRLSSNHALDYASHLARDLGKPLVIYEGLRLDYPWASARLHRFMLDGMRDNARRAAELGLCYWPYVETPDQSAKGLLARISKDACAVVTDDYPAYIVPFQIEALAKQIDVPLIAVDGNCIVPLAKLGAQVSTAPPIRSRIHKLFGEAWSHRSDAEPAFPKGAKIDPPFRPFDTEQDLTAFVPSLPIDQAVTPVETLPGGTVAATGALDTFMKLRLRDYAEGRNTPDDPVKTSASGLSAYLRHGHLSAEQLAGRVLSSTGGEWTADRLNAEFRGKRDGYYSADTNITNFLDEAVTWRDVGYHWWYCRGRAGKLRAYSRPKGWEHPIFCDLKSSIPAWAMATLNEHRSDKRDPIYSLERLENADTKDEIWNAAQRELVGAGRVHNYMRMLWGKKVLEWSKTPEIAYATLEHLNNKYALDGRDPNSYTGILWIFGLFDRPWMERDIFGSVRYMSSDSTRKKFKLANYLAYTKRLTRRKDLSTDFADDADFKTQNELF